jgi:hypothetical protein
MADGSFDLASDSVNRVTEVGVTPGTYRVQVSAPRIVDEDTIHWNAPERYADFRSSGLGVTINKPTDNLVIELTWADEKRAEATESSAQAPVESNEIEPSPRKASASSSRNEGTQ